MSPKRSMRIGTVRSSTRRSANNWKQACRTTLLLREDFLKMSISTGPIASRPASSASTWLMLPPAARRKFRQTLLRIVLRVGGVADGRDRITLGGLDPPVQLRRPIPIWAWLPYSIAVFGIRDMGAVFLIALGAFYPIVVNTAQGARDIERNIGRAARMMGGGRWRILRGGGLPASMA